MMCKYGKNLLKVLYLFHGYGKNQKPKMQITKSGKHKYDPHQARLLDFLRIHFAVSDFYAFAVLVP